MADEKPYELEPEEPAETSRTGPAGGSMGSAPASRPGSAAPAAKIDAPGLLNDFDEDADFSDPGPAKPAARGTPGPADPGAAWPPIVTDASVIPLVGNPKVLGIAGGLLLLGAVIVTGITTTSGRALIPPLITLYEGIVHTGTGVVAVLVASRFAERRVNRVELIAARMLVIVSAFLIVSNLNIPIPGRIDEFLLGAGAYYLALMLLFRLPRFETGLIGGIHFCLWVLMKIGAFMYEVNRAAPAAQG